MPQAAQTAEITQLSPTTRSAETSDNQQPADASSPGKITVERLSFGRTIGRGTYGRVKVAQDKQTGRSLAVKETAKTRIRRAKDLDQVMNEKTILASIRHPFIVDFYDTFQDGKNLYLAMEFIQGGDLYSFLTARRKFTLAETRFFAAEIAAAFHYLHSQGIVYRDLKAENILISKTGHIKLADFGCAKRLKSGERTFTICGTSHFVAPEMLARSGHSFAVDWWTLGVLLHKMLTGAFPFAGESPHAMYSKIMSRPYYAPREADTDMQDLLEGLLEKDPNHRFGYDQVCRNRSFARVNWMRLESLRPCFVPVVKTDLDDSNFHRFGEEPDAEGEIQFEDELQAY